MPVITLDVNAGRIAGPFTMGERDAIGGLPERAWNDPAGFRFQPSRANLSHLRETLPGAVWHDPAGVMAEYEAMAALEGAAHREPDDADRAYLFRTEPRPRQLKAFAFARFLKYFALFMDPGTGKTWCGLNIAAAKFEDGEIDCVLIVAPNGVHTQWIDEQVARHLPDIDHVARTYSERKADYAEMLEQDAGRLRILAVNVEALSRDGHAFKYLIRYLRSGRCMMIVDESTRIKNRSASRTKHILKLAPLAAVRAILTGTPITKNILDLWSQFQFLSADILGFRSFFAFRDRYCITAPAFRGAAMGVVKIVGHRNMGELIARIAPYVFRATKDDLPEKSYERRAVALSPEQRKHYNALVKSFRTELDAGSLSAVNAAARTVRLQQILSGYLPANDEGNAGAVTVFPQYRTNALLDFLDDIGDRQLVVWARFHHDVDVIAAALDLHGVTFVVCDGRVDAAERTRRKQDFISGLARVYVGTEAVGTGTDGLQVTGLCMMYSHTYDAEKRWQMEDRTHRDGMTATSMVYIDLYVPNSIDEQILTNTGDKRTLAERVISNPALLREV